MKQHAHEEIESGTDFGCSILSVGVCRFKSGKNTRVHALLREGRTSLGESHAMGSLGCVLVEGKNDVPHILHYSCDHGPFRHEPLRVKIISRDMVDQATKFVRRGVPSPRARARPRHQSLRSDSVAHGKNYAPSEQRSL